MSFWFDDEDIETITSKEQCLCEINCAGYLGVDDKDNFSDDNDNDNDNDSIGVNVNNNVNVDNNNNNNNNNNKKELFRENHILYLRSALRGLSRSFITLDSSRPWICYWVTHALHLLDSDPIDIYPHLIHTLSLMQNRTGGFAGNIHQESHCAPTYAAILCLCTIGTKEALEIIDRNALYDFFLSMKVWLKDNNNNNNNKNYAGFRMHLDGEVDCRGTYTVLAIARLLNILTPELVEGVADFILSCATYEGGFGGEPGNEAHGGYNFCAMAGLLILGEDTYSKMDLDAQEYWLIRRQMQIEGGFQGRTNKLVDACYSFWQGAALSIVDIMRNKGSDISDLYEWRKQKQEQQENNSFYVSIVHDNDGKLSFNQKRLQKYIIRCGQVEGGGLRDKPGKSRDYYHSCYSLSGLSIAQWANNNNDDTNTFNKAFVYGDATNVILPTSSTFNIGLDKLDFCYKYFHNS